MKTLKGKLVCLSFKTRTVKTQEFAGLKKEKGRFFYRVGPYCNHKVIRYKVMMGAANGSKQAVTYEKQQLDKRRWGQRTNWFNSPVGFHCIKRYDYFPFFRLWRRPYKVESTRQCLSGSFVFLSRSLFSFDSFELVFILLCWLFFTSAPLFEKTTFYRHTTMTTKSHSRQIELVLNETMTRVMKNDEIRNKGRCCGSLKKLENKWKERKRDGKTVTRSDDKSTGIALTRSPLNAVSCKK